MKIRKSMIILSQRLIVIMLGTTLLPVETNRLDIKREFLNMRSSQLSLAYQS